MMQKTTIVIISKHPAGTVSSTSLSSKVKTLSINTFFFHSVMYLQVLLAMGLSLFIIISVVLLTATVEILVTLTPIVCVCCCSCIGSVAKNVILL